MSDMLEGYVLGQDNNNNNGANGWGEWIWIIVLFALFGWGGNGFGGFGGNRNGGGGCGNGCATPQDIASAFDFNGIDNGIRGIQQGICDSTYALNNSMNTGFNGIQTTLCNGFHNEQLAMCNGFNGVQSSLNTLGFNLQQCCCDTQRSIDGVNYNMAKNTCDITNTMNQNTQNLLINQNNNTQRLVDLFTQDKIDSLNRELQSAQLTLAQAQQTNNIITALSPKEPVPAYLTTSPYQSIIQPTGFSFGNGCGNNCGCGCY